MRLDTWKLRVRKHVYEYTDMGRCEKMLLVEMATGAGLKDRKLIYAQPVARICHLIDYTMKPTKKAIAYLEERGYITRLTAYWSRPAQWEIHPEMISDNLPKLSQVMEVENGQDRA